MKNTFLRVFKNTRYTLLAAGASFLFFTGALWLPNLSLIESFLASSSQGYGEKASFLLSLYGLILSSHTLYSAIMAAFIAILSGINVALLVYYIKRLRKTSQGKKRTTVTSLAGLLVGVFGVGCAACGSVILTAVFTLLGAGGLVWLLPFGGSEFGVLAVCMLGASNYYLLRHINNPLVCSV
jgi:ABC-type amino acid transport system permease subunit